MQKSLFDSMFQRKKKQRRKTRVRSKLKPDIDRILGIRFAHEVPSDECMKCGLGTSGHPLVQSKNKDFHGYDNMYVKLCIKDALKMKAPIEVFKGEYGAHYDYKPEGYYKKLFGGK